MGRPLTEAAMIAIKHDTDTQGAPAPDAPYVRVMKTWARWMTLADRQEVGGWAHPQDVKEFMRCGEAVDSMVNDLPRTQWWAVRKAYGFAPRAPYDPETMETALLQAATVLERKMQNNIATRIYFN